MSSRKESQKRKADRNNGSVSSKTEEPSLMSETQQSVSSTGKKKRATRNSSQKPSNRRDDSSEISPETNTQLQNQPQTRTVSSSASRGRPAKPVEDIILTMFEYDADTKSFTCRFCPKTTTDTAFKRKYLLTHLQTIKHQHFVKGPEYLKKMQDLIQYLESLQKEEIPKDTKLQYLEFLGYTLGNRFSFEQIEGLGKFLGKMAKENKLGFLGTFSFDSEEISNIAVEFGACILEEIKTDLENTKYSMSVDNVTINGTGMCGVKVRYLKQYEHKIQDSGTQTSIQLSRYENKFIGIKYLQESSEAKVILDVVKGKLLNLSDSIPQNLIGYVHDRGSNLDGCRKGLGALLTKEIDHHFYDLQDPCHSLNLVLSRSLVTLPDEMTDFIDSIHTYFCSPQRTAKLQQIQEKKNMNKLGLVDYAKTRWLSLGESLERILDIWPDLEDYMQQEVDEIQKKVEKDKEKEKGESDKSSKDRDKEKDRESNKSKGKEAPQKPNKCEEFLSLLKNKCFKLKISLLSGLVGIINTSNIIFQTPDLEVHKIKKQIEQCVKTFISLLFKDSKLSIATVQQLDLENQKVKQNYFETNFETFMRRAKLLAKIPFIQTNILNANDKEEVLNDFKPFIASIISYLF